MPFSVTPDVLRTAASTLGRAGEDASARLADSRGEAAGARAGFPGDAAAPFAAMLGALDDLDESLLRAVRAASTKVDEVACAYDDREAQNLSLIEKALMPRWGQSPGEAAGRGLGR